MVGIIHKHLGGGAGGGTLAGRRSDVCECNR